MPSLVPKFVYRLAPFRRNSKGTVQIVEEANQTEAHHHSNPPADDQNISPTRALSENDILNFVNQGEKHQLIPKIIDHNSSHNPEKVFASIPADNNDLSKGFRDITYVELSKAVDKAAFWLEETLGPAHGEAASSSDGQQDEAPKSSFPTFAFYGTRDLRYSIFAVAAMKVGYKVGQSSNIVPFKIIVPIVETPAHTSRYIDAVTLASRLSGRACSSHQGN
jgi:hypothetical protein